MGSTNKMIISKYYLKRLTNNNNDFYYFFVFIFHDLGDIFKNLLEYANVKTFLVDRATCI